MQQGWKPIKSLDYLFSEEMATSLGQKLAHRADEQNKRKQQDLRYGLELGEAHASALAGKIGKAEIESFGKRSSESVQTFLKENKFDKPPSDPTPYPQIEYPMLVAPRSCVSSFGPYNNWGDQEGGGAGEVVLVLGPSPRNIGGNCAFVAAGSGRVWGGSGCWFRVDTPGTSRLNVTFLTNGRAALAAPLGYSHTHVRFYGAVWGAAENRWVDRGGVGADLINAYMWAFVSWDVEVTSVTVPFDTVAGGVYYCFGWFQLWSGCGGLASGGSRFRSLLNPLQVCTP
jgi:hypothetical protein